jgi:ABC-type nitrate/sulfonate/bicarbonate transport system ATPase subunit
VLVPYTYRDTILKIDNVCVSYDGRPILKNVCAEIRDIYIPGRVTGQIVAFLGPSGIGKTTLFRNLAGLERPTSGQILLARQDGLAPVQVGQVGVVAQNYPLFAHRTVLGNLMQPLRQHGDKNAKDVAMEALRQFEIEDKAHLYPCQLSGGQKQRVAILQMILCKEKLILMDEPFSGLDLIKLEKACELIQQAANLDDLNTIIVVTHDVTAAVSIADHIWLLGRDRDAQGNIIPGARIMETVDLLERGLCYEQGAVTNPKFMETVREIKERFRTL